MSATQPRISDAAVQKATGKNWDEWFALLDGEGAGGAAAQADRAFALR